MQPNEGVVNLGPGTVNIGAVGRKAQGTIYIGRSEDSAAALHAVLAELRAAVRDGGGDMDDPPAVTKALDKLDAAVAEGEASPGKLKKAALGIAAGVGFSSAALSTVVNLWKVVGDLLRQ